MQLEIENPYASPRAFDAMAAQPLPRRTDWLRGMAMALLWEAVGFVAILAIAFAARVIFVGREPLLTKIQAATQELPQFVGPAIFFGSFFALAAIATYAPSIHVNFGRTLSLTFIAFIMWIAVLALITFPFEWPLLAFPSSGHQYQPSLAIQLWVGGWFLLGPALFTGWMTWRRMKQLRN